MMCPDHEILSVYFDNELYSPWKEKLEAHLASCPQCRARLETYESAHKALIGPQMIGQNALEAARDRIWEKLESLTETRRKPGVFRRFWNGSLSIPCPVAAAASIVLIAVFALILALRSQAGMEQGNNAQYALGTFDDHASIGIETNPVPDMGALLEYLNRDTSADMVIIKLPETIFTNVGEPRVIRAADYSKNDRKR